MSDMQADLAAEDPIGRCGNRRMQLPPLPLDGIPEPLRIHLDFDAVMVDEILRRLTLLRSQMVPAPVAN